ncbi:hypothetical protein JEM67_20975 [Serratia sp. PAMC26656]|uniref:hypothetical protein n=1 Tax=Serratia sp. PAMC26656 TaxID=2775909 RepID=UPI0018F79EB4|nr:hypothetical protein [Serratia sp. PAMC26656]MBJ7892216.1 hypothetical protein [Serratia sp. PAMC26656]
MKNNLVNQDIKTDKPLAMSYEALKADRDAQQKRADALAVENAALRVAVDGFNEELYGKGFEVLGWHLNGATEPLDNWFGDNDWNPETPATDAALEAIRSQAVDEFADSQIQKSLEHRAIGNSGLADVYNDNAMDAKVFAMRLREAIELREAK